MRRLAALLPFLALAACTATSSDAPASADEALVSDAMCATLDYGPRAPAADLYQFLDDDAAATAYMQRVEATGYIKTVGGPTAKFREITHDPRLLRLVSETYEGMRRVFPRETADLPTAPRVAVVDTPIQNAYVLARGINVGDPAPWLFVVHSSILAVDDDQLMGVMAHELGHLVLRNSAADVRPRISASYVIDERGENGIFGAKQTNDPLAAELIPAVQLRQYRVGWWPDLGFGPRGFGMYVSGLESMMAGNTSPSACSAVDAAMAELGAAQIPFMAGASTIGAQPPQPTAEERAHIQALSDGAIAALRTCFASETDGKTIADFYRARGYPESVLDTWMLEAEKDADNDASLRGAGERMLVAEQRIRADVVALRNSLGQPYSHVRQYDSEEDSDDASVRVMRALGRDPTANGRFLLGWLTPEAKADCLAAVAAGKEINYGDIRDVHPAHCWRYYHQMQLDKSLAACPATPTTRRVPSGGNTLVTPVDPLEFIAKPSAR